RPLLVRHSVPTRRSSDLGMGGGGFWLLHDTHQNRHVFVDARETAPLKAHQDMYLDEAGNVVRDLAINTPLAAGIPGQAAAFVHLDRKSTRLNSSHVSISY